MEFKPNDITSEHILKAIEKIEKENISLIPPTRWEVLINGKNYPPKEVMRYAHQQMNGEKIWDYGGGEATNKYLKKMGFNVSDIQNNPVKEIIRKYKYYINEGGLKGEEYKWNLLAKFKGRPNPNVSNFYEEIKSINFANLIYPIGQAVIKHIAQDRTEPYKDCFKVLFDENIDLTQRVKYFNEETLKIYRQIVPEEKFSHHQDERTMATFLTYYNPDKYTLYKHSFYQKYCVLLDIKPQKKGKKYVHYLELLNDFIDDYIKDDQELIDLIKSKIPLNSFEDTHHKMLAQDILYQSLDKRIGSEKKYWRVGTKDDRQSYWKIMKTDEKISIGWSEIGDLDNTVVTSKKQIMTLLKEKNFFNNDNINLSKKAGEIFNFYNSIKIGDVILAQDGETILGIGIIKDNYYYNPDDTFSHQKLMDWKIFNPTLKNSQGNRTTVYEVTNSNMINKVEALLNNTITTTMTNPSNQNIPLNQILYGPPGTGKTYNTVLEAAKIITDNENIHYDEALEVFNNNLTDQIEFITFHQNYSYEDFIQGIRPDTENGKELSFEKKDGVFKRIADRAYKNLEESKNPASAKKEFDIVFQELIQPLTDGDVEELEIKMIKSNFYLTEIGEKSIEFRKNIGISQHTLSINTLRKMYEKGENDIILGGLQPYYNPILTLLLEKGKSPLAQVERKNYVIIIDEINRANISRVFGELITLIEKDKRSEGKIAMRVTLPSGDSFIVPSNLYIIGTMNTADKSIALLDIALRRRFDFIPKYPDPSIIGVHDGAVLTLLNNAVQSRKGYDFTIGHAYFMGDDYTLENTVNKKVIPLLLEYFMNNEDEVTKIFKEANIAIGEWPLKMLS
ncbi:AAA family ATPase [uncultured Flavobacterium sp.]|uniref:AAA family ATPase n=1 Tax=uncultured Flavobacterium sp. TaxID=165435 RepID=UPI00292EEDD3|nr:AAA family ATPase [uncultured Flavobacterium sp.]